MSGRVIWGSETIPGVTHVEVNTRPQQATPVRTQPETTRSDRQGLRQLKFVTFDKGLGVKRGSETTQGNVPDIQRYFSSQGLWAHPFGNLTLPPIVTQQTLTTDSSAHRVNNLRVHHVLTTLGQEKIRSWFGLGKLSMRTTSDSNPALVGIRDWNNNIIGAFEGYMDGDRCIFVCTDGLTDDVQAITDPTTSPETMTTAFAMGISDWYGGGAWFFNLGGGFNIFYGRQTGVSGFWFTRPDDPFLTTPRAVALTATKDLPGNMAAITYAGNIEPLKGTADPGSGTLGNALVPNLTFPWWNTVNILALDTANYAYVDIGSAGFVSPGESTDYLYADFSGAIDDTVIADADTVVSFKIHIHWMQADVTEDWFLKDVRLMIRGSALGVNQSDQTVEGTTSFSETEIQVNLAGYHLTGKDLQSLAIRMQWFNLGNPDQLVSLRVDAVYISDIVSQPTGQMGLVPAGGFIAGIDPLDAFALYIIAPEWQDETDGIDVPRILWRAQFEYDSARDQPTVTVEKVPTLLGNVEGICFAQGGVIVFGDTETYSSDFAAGKACKRLQRKAEGSWDVFDQGFGLGQGYAAPFFITNVFSGERSVVVDVVSPSESAAFAMMVVDGKWHMLEKPQTGVSKQTLAYAEAPGIEPTQRYRYRFIPSGSDTVVQRQYQPRNLLQDPFTSIPSIIKEDGVLVLRTPELDALGPEESNKSLLTAWFLGRDISSSNTVRLRYSTDGGASFSTWTTFTSAFSKANLTTPVQFRTVIFEIGLDHQTGTTGTPNGLQLLIEGVPVWTNQRSWTVVFNPEDMQFQEKYRLGGVESLFDNLKTLQVANPIQSFNPGNGISKLAVWDETASAYNAMQDPLHERGAAANTQNPVPHRLVFLEVSQ